MILRSLISLHYSMIYLIVGNILSFIGVVLLGISSLVHDKKRILFYQIYNCLFTTLSNIVLGGFSGATVNFAALVRNWLVYHGKNTHKITIVIAIIMTIIGVSVNQHGIIGTLPIIASIQYTLWLGWGFTSAQSVKLALAINVSIWAVYDAVIMAFPSLAVRMIILGLSVLGYYKSASSQSKKSRRKTPARYIK